uniref:Uncharacterized protein n=1 Tax=CrAss-like virus sp. ctYsL76 TaxID=2826826 RepID=A0A8S5QMU4_9CAUD|nr:MAG TPA: hypothetical protein [CrAss-like virus sp. ctYsL76]
MHTYFNYFSIICGLSLILIIIISTSIIVSERLSYKTL